MVGTVIAKVSGASGGATLAVEGGASSTTYELSKTDGSANDHLKTDGSGNLSWVAPPSGFDSIALLSTQTASTSASINFDNTLITSDYKTYEFKYMNVVGSADGEQFQMKFSDDNGSNFDSNHTGGMFEVYTGGSGAGTGYISSHDSLNEAYQNLNDDLSFDAGDSCGGNVIIQNPSNSSFITTYQGQSSAITHHGTPYQYTMYTGGMWDSLAAVDYIRFQMSSGNLVTGTIQLWGYK